MKYITLTIALLLTGCVSNSKEPVEPKVITKTTTKFVSVPKEYTPQLWSQHKLLKGSPETCATNGVNILSALGFKSVVKNGHYVYGNFSNNRAAIKCVELNANTFVYIAVAGADVKLVEKLRNEIAWKL